MLKSGCFALAMAASLCCHAQEIAQPAAEAAQAAAPQPLSSVVAPCCRIADGTPVTIEILEPLNSALLKRGDKFRIRLAEPLLIGGETALASGMEGVGEVVHAEKSRGGGKAGELLLAARHLDHQGTPIRLRGLKLGGAGKDNSRAAVALAIAAGPLAFFVQGREIVIPAGTPAQAKIAQDPDPVSILPTPEGAAAAANTSEPVADIAAAATPTPTPTPTPTVPATTTTSPAAAPSIVEPQPAEETATHPNSEE